MKTFEKLQNHQNSKWGLSEHCCFNDVAVHCEQNEQRTQDEINKALRSLAQKQGKSNSSDVKSFKDTPTGKAQEYDDWRWASRFLWKTLSDKSIAEKCQDRYGRETLKKLQKLLHTTPKGFARLQKDMNRQDVRDALNALETLSGKGPKNGINQGKLSKLSQNLLDLFMDHGAPKKMTAQEKKEMEDYLEILGMTQQTELDMGFFDDENPGFSISHFG